MTLPRITGATAPTGQFCADCRYNFSALRDGRLVAWCARTDLVDGSGNNATACHDERLATSDTNCGRDGKFWEAK